MKLRTFIANNFWYYWRSHLAVMLAAATATAVLVGALALGDCVRETLRRQALSRPQLAVMSGSRFFDETLARPRMDVRLNQANKPGGPVTVTQSLIVAPGRVSRGQTDAANDVQVIGVEGAAGNLDPSPAPTEVTLGQIEPAAAVNPALARRLNLHVGDQVVVHVAKPEAMAFNSPMLSTKDNDIRFSIPIKWIVQTDPWVNFSLQANSSAPLNIYLPREFLAGKLGVPRRANTLLIDRTKGAEIGVSEAQQALEQVWELSDAGLEFRAVGQGKDQRLEVTSRRIFLDDDVADAAAKTGPCMGVLTWFVNELRVGDRATPYSFVCASGALEVRDASEPQIIAPGPKDDEIWISEWLAKDLSAKAGDELTMSYFVLGPDLRLGKAQAKFKIAGIVPMTSPACDRTLTPEFPGLTNVESCAKWDSDLIDVKKVRKQDEEYWNAYRATPKAFISLAAGRKMWANPLGALTSVRFLERDQARVESAVRSHLTAGSRGLVVHDVRKRMLAAVQQGTDFGQLYLGFSFFVLAAALGLVAMVFSLGVRARSAQVGLLLTVGWRRRKVMTALLAESLLSAAGGALAGTVAGLLYTRTMLHGLETSWSAAVGGMTFGFYPAGASIAIGAGAGLAGAMVTILLTLLRQFRLPPRVLLAGEEDVSKASRPRVSRASCLRLRWPRWSCLADVIVAVLAMAVAAIILVFSPPARRSEAAAPFFIAGAMLLVAAIATMHWRLRRATRNSHVSSAGGLVAMALRGASRRTGRSLAVVAIVACATFILAAVGVNRQDAQSHVGERSSGAGGFALVAESSLPVVRDFNSARSLKTMGVPEDAQVQVVPIRLHEGDRADCLNLNRAIAPRILGVEAAELDRRKAFTFAEAAKGSPRSWACLDGRLDDGDIPAVADENALWSLGKTLGERIEFTDARGRTVRLRLVGVIASSVLQGGVLISLENFAACFPSDGNRLFLIDASSGREQEVARTLTRELSGYGMSVMRASDRLGELEAVENSYLDIFTLLGGLGMALGSVGLAAVVMRNVLERRGELAVLQAVGFTRARIRGMVMLEHVYLLAAGVACGLVAAAVAAGPSIARGLASGPLTMLAAVLAIVVIGGTVWTAVATAVATRGSLLGALRSE